MASRTKVEPGIWKRQLASGEDRFEIVYRDENGVQVRETVPGGVTAARSALKRKSITMEDGGTGRPMRLTFSEAADLWLASIDAGDLRPTTASAYRGHVETHLRPAFGRLRLDKIRAKDVRALVGRMRTAEYRRDVERKLGRETHALTGYKAWTIRGVLVAAGLIFDHVKDTEEWRGANPVRELRRKDRPRVEEKERRILTRDELARVIAAADSRYRPVIQTAASLGTRLGETLGIRWRDVDLEAGTIAVRFQADRSGERVALKTTRSKRIVEMPGSLVSMLRAHKLATSHSRPDDFVFATEAGEAFGHRTITKQGLTAACRRADIAKPWPTFHELRHAHASAWIAEGGDLVELSSRLGHADPSITAGVYSHEFEAAARSSERRARLDAMYGGDVAANVAASEVDKPQLSATGTDGKVVDLQAKRNGGQ